MDDRPPLEYGDFAIRIEADGRGGFEARVVTAPRGGTARAPFVPPFEAATLDAVLDGVGRAVRAGAPSRHLEAAPPVAGAPFDPKTAGMALFDALFQDGVRRCFDFNRPRRSDDGDQGLRLRLIIDPLEPGCAAIAALPWELLCDPIRGYLCTRIRTPVVRFLEVESPHRVRKIRGPLRVLIALASPAELSPLDLASERAAAEAWDEGAGIDVEVLQPATIDMVRKRLRRRHHHVLHFTGHGAYLPGEERGVLYFEGEDGAAAPADSAFLAALLDDCSSIRLVVLNACFGARVPRRDGLDPYAGIASALVRAGVPAVAAMQFPISDRAAVRFCRDLYQSLAAGDPVDAAVAEGRRGILQASPASLEWAAPVLHLQVTDGRLFERRSALPRRLAAALAALIAVAAAVGGWLWFERSNREAQSARQPYQRPALTSAAGCPPPSSVPGMAFVRIEPGRLELPPEGDEGPRVLEVEKPYCLGALEATEEEWRTVMGTTEDRPARPDDPDLPAGRVSWDDALDFIGRLNSKAEGSPFHLPTGEQWEFAARGGETTAYSFGDDAGALPRYGNCRSGWLEDDGFDGPAPVGSFAPNPFGLYDMHGNLSEWVDEPAGDPEKRVKRGGSYDSSARNCESDARSEVIGERRNVVNGFRLARDVEPDS